MPALPHWVLENKAWRGPVGCRFHSVGEYVGHICLPLIACMSHTVVYPAYSIVVEYHHGIGLLKHYDQNRWLEIARVILQLLFGAKTWPTYYGDGECFDKREGGAYPMSGHEIPHWREPLEGERAVPLILRDTSDPAKECGGRAREAGTRQAARGLGILARYGA